MLERARKEQKILPDAFAIMFHRPNYFLPYYYTGSPDNAVYQGLTPEGEQLKHSEVKYQISLKVPVWKNIYTYHSSLFFAYTQLSYWQLYNRNTFFRETDYEPELFLANEVNWEFLAKNWHINFLNLGINHQSNGYGNALQRGWNRIYVDAIMSGGNWMVDIKPWYVLTRNHNNDDIPRYMGYANFLVSYKYYQQVFALQFYNLIENNPRRASAELTWSFPLLPYIKGYVQVFSGYGQSLIEYNHRTNSAGIGLALSDWV